MGIVQSRGAEARHEGLSGRGLLAGTDPGLQQ